MPTGNSFGIFRQIAYTPGNSCTLGRSAQPEFVRLFLHGGQAEGDVGVYFHAEFECALSNVVAADGTGEGLILELLLDGGDVDIEDAAAGADVADGGEKAGEFVAGAQVWVEKAVDDEGPYLEIHRTREVAVGPLGVMSIAVPNDRYFMKEG